MNFPYEVPYEVNLIREVHCNLQIINEYELYGNLKFTKAFLYYSEYAYQINKFFHDLSVSNN